MRSFERTSSATAPVEPVDNDLISCPVEWSQILRTFVLLGSLEHATKWPFERTSSWIACPRTPCPSMVKSKLDVSELQILMVSSQEALAKFLFGKALIENVLLVCLTPSSFFISFQAKMFSLYFSRIPLRWIDPSLSPKAIQLFAN